MTSSVLLMSVMVTDGIISCAKLQLYSVGATEASIADQATRKGMLANVRLTGEKGQQPSCEALIGYGESSGGAVAWRALDHISECVTEVARNTGPDNALVEMD